MNIAFGVVTPCYLVDRNQLLTGIFGPPYRRLLFLLIETCILQRVEPLLCNDSEISKYTIAFSRQRLGKHVPAATDTKATILRKQRNGVFCDPRRDHCYCNGAVNTSLWKRIQNRRAVFSTWSVSRGYTREEV
jgi:hypothetical protein